MNGNFFHPACNWIFTLLLVLTACTPAPQPTQQPIHQPTPQPTEEPTPQPAVPAAQSPLGIVANQSWQDVYAFVYPGDQLEFMATGTWSHNPTDPQFSNHYGPGGVNVFDPAAILPSAPLGSLVGRIGDHPPFLIGEHLMMTSEYRGKLQVSMNDIPDQFSNNTGLVGVVVSLTPKAVDPGIRLTSTRDGYTLVYPHEYFVVITPTGICLTQNPRPDAAPCELPITAALEIRESNHRTVAQLANEIINVNDPNFRFDRYEMLVDGEPAMRISREGNEELLNMVIIVHKDHVYVWRFLFREVHPGLGQEDQIMNEISRVQKFYDTVINSFQFLG